MTLTSFLVFVLLAGTLAAWVLLALIPAFVELRARRDAEPLPGVGRDSGSLFYFANSFLTRATAEGLLGPGVPATMSDGSRVLTHGGASSLEAGPDAFREVVVVTDASPLPPGAVMLGEVVAQQSLAPSDDLVVRALLGMRDVTLGENSTVLRWVHARGVLEAREGVQLLGRATSDRTIVLSPGVTFQRIEADTVLVAGADPPPPSDTREKVPWTPRGGVQLGKRYWRVLGDVEIPAGAVLEGALVATGSVLIGEGARIRGSVKAQELLVVCRGAEVEGALSAWGGIGIESGARIEGPVISESDITVEAATIGMPGGRTTVVGNLVTLAPGATLHGAVMAATGRVPSA
ncbi:MAG: polymer-forming cytoskeletal protein [Gemmatimonadetes bacterium]|nr:polymer-forming cytoskeletal protein [Gemmatimonadota bacterium]